MKTGEKTSELTFFVNEDSSPTLVVKGNVTLVRYFLIFGTKTFQ